MQVGHHAPQGVIGGVALQDRAPVGLLACIVGLKCDHAQGFHLQRPHSQARFVVLRQERHLTVDKPAERAPTASLDVRTSGD